MSRFGEHLLARGVISADQHAETLRAMQVYGGRFGTNLVERGYLRLEELAAHLADYFGLPLPPVAWVEQPDPQAVRLLPMPLIRRYKILPLQLEGGVIHVAMIDPTNAAQLDFVGQAAGRPVQAYVLPEVRLLYWLETHLGIDRHPRYVNLATRSRTTGEWGRRDLDAESRSRRAPEPAAESPPEDWLVSEDGSELAAFWDEGDEEILLEEIVKELPEGPACGPPGPASESGSCLEERPLLPPDQVSHLEAQLLGAGSREAIGRLALDLARAYCRAAALFVVRDGTVRGLAADGPALASRIEGFEVPEATPSLFALPAVRREPFRGPPPEDGIDGRLMAAIGRAECAEVLVQPVLLRDRVVNLLYADNGPDVFGETSVAALAATCRCISAAYERLILDKKEGRRARDAAGGRA